MLSSLRKNGLTSLFKEVRVFCSGMVASPFAATVVTAISRCDFCAAKVRVFAQEALKTLKKWPSDCAHSETHHKFGVLLRGQTRPKHRFFAEFLQIFAFS